MNKIAAFCITIYQKISAVFPPQCRFVPTCSEYAKQAFGQHAFPKAFILAIVRVVRCNPFVRGGSDYLKPW